jgi:MscS family membrane protein
MNTLLDKIILNNTLLSYLICFGTILLAVAFKRYLGRYVAGLVYRIIQKASWAVDKKTFVDLLVGPLETFFLILVTIITLDKLNFPNAFKFTILKTNSHNIIDAIGNGIVIIAFIWLLLRIIDFIATVLKRKADITPQASDNNLIVFLKDFLKVVLVIIGILLIIRFSFGKDIGNLLAGLSIVAGALALAARESLENLIASFIIFFDTPFNVGDLVKVNNITGTVEKIGLRSTRLRTEDKTWVTMPNKQMVDSIMDNLTLRNQRRGILKLEISLGTSPETLQRFITDLKKIVQHPLVENYTVFLSDIATNCYLVQAEYYTATIPIADFNQMKQQINLQVIAWLKENNVELAGMNTEIKISR